MGKDKKPKSRIVPNVEKLPRASEARSYNIERPSWRIGRMEFVDPFGWHVVSGDGLHLIRERLKAFESMTWNEILIHGKKQNHSVAISDLCKDARDRLSDLYRGNLDLDELISLRLTGGERVWGIREEAVFSILWWDPHHRVCPSHLKNT